MPDLTKIPFCQHLGLEAVQVANVRSVGLKSAAHHQNHLETIHAGVLYTVAETAAGQAVIDSFPQLAEDAIVVLHSASVKYHQPGRETAHAVADLDEDSCQKFLPRFQRRGMGRILVHVKVMESTTLLMSGTYAWAIRKRDDA